MKTALVWFALGVSASAYLHWARYRGVRTSHPFHVVTPRAWERNW